MPAESQPSSVSVASYQKVYLEGKKLKHYLDVSENSGTPKSSLLIGFSKKKHPFWGTPIFGNTHLMMAFLGGESIQSNETQFENFYVLIK